MHRWMSQELRDKEVQMLYSYKNMQIYDYEEVKMKQHKSLSLRLVNGPLMLYDMEN